MSKYPGRVLSATPPAVSQNGASGVWTQEEVAKYNAEGIWPQQPLPYDPYFQNVTLLLHGDGNQGATNFSNISDPVYLAFKDNSDNNFPITVNGDAYGDNFGPYAVDDGYWSNYFDGSGDYLTTPSNAAFGFGTGDFTIEGWWFFTGTISTYQRPWGFGDDNDNIEINGSVLRVGGGSQGTLITGTTTILQNTWYHIALVRSSGTYKLYLNGTQEGSSASNSYNSGTRQFAIMAYTNGANPSTGYVSNARIVKGTAVYTGNFTPSTTPLTAISGTSLLTCQSNRFVDNSSNNFTITPAGNVATKVFNPFGELPDGVNGSGYFDGSGDYLSLVSNSAFAFGTGDFTVEAWVYPLSRAAVLNICGTRGPAGTANGWNWGILTDGSVQMYSNGAIANTGANTVPLNAWTLITFTRSSGTITGYINGVSKNTAANSQDFSIQDFWIGITGGSAEPFNGYISNLRLLKGTAVTPSVPTAPFTNVTNTSILTTQYAGTVRNVGFIDSGPYDFPITRYGNTTQGSFSPFSKPDGRWGNYFNGTAAIQDGILSVPDNAALVLTGTAFTIEAWVNMTYNTTSYTNWIVGKRSTSGGTGYAFSYVLGINPSGYPHFFNGTFDVISSTAISLNTWNHVCVTHDGTNATLYLNGSVVAGPTAATIVDTSAAITIGNYSVDTPEFNGYISGVKIVKGYANAPSGIPTTPATNTTGTSLLTCQSNRFVDNSTNNFAITAAGNVKVTPFSPFPLNTTTGAYNPTDFGGSAYLDGSGDYLTVGTTINWSTFGSYTLEFWAYHVTLATNVWYLVSDNFSAGETGWYVYADGSIAVGINTVNQIVSSAGAVKAGQWQHIAYTYDGTTTKIYVNGVQVASGTTAVYANVSATISTGTGGGNTLVGYLSGMRIVKSVVYASAFTPPTAPLTAISGTHTLLNFTNAGIYDSSAFNDLETVGNAQVDTSIVKFGTGSMKFVRSPSSYLVAPNQYAQFSFGTGDFTVEAWVYLNTLPAGNGYSDSYWIVGGGPANSNTGFDIAIGSTNLQVGLTDFASLNINVSHGMTTGTWYHIAIVRSGATLYAFKDGVQLTTASVSGVSADPMLTGLVVSAAEPSGATLGNFNGFIDDLRITKGVARYTANFTPPTIAFRNIGA